MAGGRKGGRMTKAEMQEILHAAQEALRDAEKENTALRGQIAALTPHAEKGERALKANATLITGVRKAYRFVSHALTKGNAMEGLSMALAALEPIANDDTLVADDG